MLRSLFSLVLLGCVAAGSRAQDATKQVTGPAPTMLVVSSVEAGEFLLSKNLVAVAVPVVVEKQVNVGGMIRVVKEFQTRSELREETMKHALRGMEFYDARGEKVKKEDAFKRLTPGAVVLMSADGKKVHPAYLRIFKDDTLILVQPK
jgi:hypothetical protein